MPVIVGTLPHDLALAVLVFEQLLFRQPLSFRLGPYALGLHGPARFPLRKSFAGFRGALFLVKGELRLPFDGLHSRRRRGMAKPAAAPSLALLVAPTFARARPDALPRPLPKPLASG